LVVEPDLCGLLLQLPQVPDLKLKVELQGTHLKLKDGRKFFLQ
jgi:hypothetical protein